MTDSISTWATFWRSEADEMKAYIQDDHLDAETVAFIAKHIEKCERQAERLEAMAVESN